MALNSMLTNALRAYGPKGLTQAGAKLTPLRSGGPDGRFASGLPYRTTKKGRHSAPRATRGGDPGGRNCLPVNPLNAHHTFGRGAFNLSALRRRAALRRL